MDQATGNIKNFFNKHGTLLTSICILIITAGLIFVATTYRDASSLNTGTVAPERLPKDVARYNSKDHMFYGRIKAELFVGNVNGNTDTATSLANDPDDCQPGEFAIYIDSMGNLSCSNDGSGLADLNASNVSFGTLSDSRLTNNIAKYNDARPTFTGNLKAAGFTGNLTGNVNGNATTATSLAANPSDCTFGAFANSIDASGNLGCSTNGSSLTDLNASNITTGTLNDGRLSSNVPLKNAANTFTAVNTFTNPANSFTGSLIGNASTATALQDDPDDCVTGAFAWKIAANGDLTCTTDGSGLTDLNASEITSGILPNARLSNNIPRKNGTSIFTGLNTFSNGGNLFTGSLTGSLIGNASTASALDSDPAPCGIGLFVNDISASGVLSCSADGSALTGISYTQISGLGSLANQSSGLVTITGGSLTGVSIASTSLTATGPVDLSGATFVKLPIRGAAPCDASRAGHIAYAGNGHFYGCDGIAWKQLDN